MVSGKDKNGGYQAGRTLYAGAVCSIYRIYHCAVDIKNKRPIPAVKGMGLLLLLRDKREES